MECKKVRFHKGRKHLEMLIQMRQGKLLFRKASDVCRDTSLIDVPINIQMANASLLHAARHNLIEEGKKALNALANPNALDKFGFTPLLWALANRNEEFAIMLLEYGASPYTRNSFGETPLMISSYFGMCETIRYIIQNNAELNARNVYRMTALMCAAQGGSEDAISLLLSAGANPTLVDSRYLSAIDYAHYLKHVEAERLLRAVVYESKTYKNGKVYKQEA